MVIPIFLMLIIVAAIVVALHYLTELAVSFTVSNHFKETTSSAKEHAVRVILAFSLFFILHFAPVMFLSFSLKFASFINIVIQCRRLKLIYYPVKQGRLKDKFLKLAGKSTKRD